MLAPFMGLIQGVTEFLPVSSSGHLRFFTLLFSEKSIPFLFDIILHIATLLAVLFFTRKILWRFLVSLFFTFSGKANMESKANLHSMGLIVLSVFFTAPFAFYIKFSVFNSVWFMKNEAYILGTNFLLTAIILLLPNLYTYFSKRKMKENYNISNVQKGNVNEQYTISNITMTVAMIVGFMQGFAALPGISRSGITISIALLLGAKKSEATYFSFLISIPTILASFLLSLDELQDLETIFSLWQIITGMLVAFVSGLLMLYVLYFIVKKGMLWVFSLYLIPLAIFILFYM